MHSSQSQRSTLVLAVNSALPPTSPLKYARSQTLSRQRRLINLPALHNFNLVHFKRPITTQREHDLFLELYFKHANRTGTNYRALLMEFNSEAARQLWKLSQQDQQSAIDSDLYFKDYRDITRYERQVVRLLLARESNNIVQLSASWEGRAAGALSSIVTTSSIHSQASGFHNGGAQGSHPVNSSSNLAQVPAGSTPANSGQGHPMWLQASPLVVRRAEHLEQRPKHGNQGGKGVIKICRRCESHGSPGVKMAGHKCPYANSSRKRKRVE
jgi:hypothetical protein